MRPKEPLTATTDDLFRSRLTGTDDDNFRSAMSAWLRGTWQELDGCQLGLTRRAVQTTHSNSRSSSLMDR